MRLYHVNRENKKGFSNYQVDLQEARHMARDGLLSLSIQIGLRILAAMILEEVDCIVGPKGKHDKDRKANRHGSEKTTVILGGQKIQIDKPRVRQKGKGKKEVTLETLAMFKSEDSLNYGILKQVLMGVTTRNYKELQQEVDGYKTYGISRDTVSRRFIAQTAKKMQEFMARIIRDEYPVMLIDGVSIGDFIVLVALGINNQGEKRVLGIREGSSENAEVCKGLIDDIVFRGLKVERTRLFILDGSKALYKAVTEKFGHDVHIQRCQLHKKRNVEGHLPDSEKARVITEMNSAYQEFDYGLAKAKLEMLAKSLEYKYPSAAASIVEGLEETLTLHKLGIPGQLRLSLSTTNPIESAIGMARDLTGRVKRWRNGTQVLRWLSCGFMECEKKFRKIKGYKLMPVLIDILSGKSDDQALRAG